MVWIDSPDTSLVLQRKKPLTRKRPMRGAAPDKAPRDRTSHQKPPPEDQALRAVWAVLADYRLAGCGFRRDERLGPYTVDFYSPGLNAAILIGDGETERQDWLAAQGYRVFAFAPDVVRYRPQQVCDALAEAFTLHVAPVTSNHANGRRN